MNNSRRNKANDQGLADIWTNHQNSQAERRDNELGRNHAACGARNRLAHKHIQNKARREQNGEQHERFNVELSAIDGCDGTGLGGSSIFRHEMHPFKESLVKPPVSAIR